jgi:hypothetical protein
MTRSRKMNGWTKDIAAVLNVSLEDALKVQDYIDNNWLIDWSEVSDVKFNRVVKAVAKVVLA